MMKMAILLIRLINGVILLGFIHFVGMIELYSVL